MTRIFLFALAALIATVSAASGPTFCKCTCFKNSTIIPLGPASQFKDSAPKPPSFLKRSDDLPLSPSPPLDRRSASTSCSECTKAFCLSQGIDFCKEAKEENVVTLCFQRVSNKDRFIVWGFILVTLGLLGWAALKRIVEWRDGRALQRQVDYLRIEDETLATAVTVAVAYVKSRKSTDTREVKKILTSVCQTPANIWQWRKLSLDVRETLRASRGRSGRAPAPAAPIRPAPATPACPAPAPAPAPTPVPASAVANTGPNATNEIKKIADKILKEQQTARLEIQRLAQAVEKIHRKLCDMESRSDHGRRQVVGGDRDGEGESPAAGQRSIVVRRNTDSDVILTGQRNAARKRAVRDDGADDSADELAGGADAVVGRMNKKQKASTVINIVIP
ncbi:hypothetical protein CP532_3338 [Ophiocordyceps camponoti-leonardi (nom. inval.)]|nr:hypothetical protein CP532_3338 [Ophiocordyceps camponoti-leonardi (nom. inval.)]